MGPARKVEAGLGLLMHLREGGTTREKLREDVVAADPGIGEVADLLRGFESIPREGAARASMPHRRFREIAKGQIDPGLQAVHSRLLDKVQPELAKADTRLVIPEVKPEHVPHSCVSVARSVAIAVLQAEVHHAADDEAAKVLVGPQCRCHEGGNNDRGRARDRIHHAGQVEQSFDRPISELPPQPCVFILDFLLRRMR